MTAKLPQEKKNVRIIKADLALQLKAGTGIIDSDRIEKSQQAIDQNKIDFIPLASESLEILDVALKYANGNLDGDPRILLTNLVKPIMQIKADAAMFGYPLVSRLAGTILDFLGDRTTVDRDLIRIVEAHYKALLLIISRRMRGDGGQHGPEIQKELEAACKRYLVKKRAVTTTR
jgi:hypothetical protein